MKKFAELLSETKAQVKALLTKDSSTEDISKVSEIDKSLDLLSSSYEEQTKEVESLKEMVINQVKNTPVKTNSSDDITPKQDEVKSLDDVLASELNKIEAKRQTK